MSPTSTERLEVFISSEMGTERWDNLRRRALGAITSNGLTPLHFEALPPGPIDPGLEVGSLGVDLARRADLAAVIIGTTVTPPVNREIEALMNREPIPPIGFFFDDTVERDSTAIRLWDRLKNQYVLSTFQTAEDLVGRISTFLMAHIHEARLNLGSVRSLLDETIVLAPGEEARRSLLLLEGDRVMATAAATGPQHHFHFALVDRYEFVRRTENLPYYNFGVGGDKYTFEEEMTAVESGLYYGVVRRPWWFHSGNVRIRLSVLLRKPTAE